MARTDSVGLFWQEQDRKKGGPVRKMPKIKSKWRAPKPNSWPNLKNAKILSIDTETYDPDLLTHGPGFARHVGHIVGISVAVSHSDSWYFPIRHTIRPESNLDPEKVLQWAKDNLAVNKGLKIGANLQYDIGWLREEGVTVSGPYLDIQDIERLINENRLKYNLDSISQRYLGSGKISQKLYTWAAKYYGGKINDTQRKNIYRCPPELVGPYAEGDAWQPYVIWKHQKKIIKKEGLERVLNIEQRLIPMLLDMRFRGVRVNLNYAEELRDVLVKKELKLAAKLNKVAGVVVNVNANKSIEKAYQRNGIKYSLTVKENPSFTKTLLQKCNHPIAKLILEIRQIAKIRSTFIENYILGKNVNGVIHCTFNAFGAKSGRFSSSKPNLQNIPVRSELGKLIRCCFLPDDNFINWYRFDYNQIEYRGLAHYAIGEGAKLIRKMYKKNPNTDYHQATVELIYLLVKLLLERKPAKTINFGLVYGMGKIALQAALGLSTKKANKLFIAYHIGVPFVKATFEHYMEIAQTTGIIKTLLGRRSRFDAFEKAWGMNIVYGEQAALRKWGPGQYQRAMCHKALNRKLQGTAADIMKIGMVKTYESGVYNRMGGVPSLTVHDELDGSCNVNEHREELKEIKHIMETCVKLKVPIIADGEIGTNWGNCKKVIL